MRTLTLYDKDAWINLNSTLICLFAWIFTILKLKIKIGICNNSDVSMKNKNWWNLRSKNIKKIAFRVRNFKLWKLKRTGKPIISFFISQIVRYFFLHSNFMHEKTLELEVKSKNLERKIFLLQENFFKASERKLEKPRN